MPVDLRSILPASPDGSRRGVRADRHHDAARACGAPRTAHRRPLARPAGAA